MQIDVALPLSRRRDVVFAVADATGITDEQGFDHLRGYLQTVVQEALHDLRHDPAEQARFADYVPFVEVCKRQTAPVLGAVGRAS